jgi:signal transduction histidine kinase
VRLQHRLALPFAAVAVAAAVVAAVFSVSQVRWWVDEDRRQDAAKAATLLQRSDFATNPALVRLISDLIAVDVVTFTPDGEVLISTIEPTLPPDVAEILSVPAASRPTECGPSCFVAYAPVVGVPNLSVAVFAGRNDDDPLLNAMLDAIWIAGIAGVVVLVGISQALARVVSAPIQRLADFAAVAAPEETRRAPEGSDEVGRLGAAFNAMLDRLDEKRRELMRTEKLAVAGLMAARVAHDVRNPLSSIKMQCQVLRAQAPAASEEAEVLAGILRDVDRLDAVVTDLVMSAKPQSAALAPVQLSSMVAAAVDSVRSQLTHRQIGLTVESGTDGRVLADAARLPRALVNILTNAAEATRPGGAIRVVTRTDGDMRVIEISDEGVGIDPALIGHIFDPFVTGRPDGIGLGLLNARDIIESHHGRIGLASGAERGTVVTIWLPAAD